MSQSDAMEEIREHLEMTVAAGYVPAEEIRESTVASMMGAFDELDDDALARAVDRLLPHIVRSHRDAQASWPAATDCDRLDAALDSLEERGISCGQNLGWDQGDAGQLMRQRIARAKGAGVVVRGYAFFNEQDTERAVRGKGLMLAFGRVEGAADLEADARIGEEIAAQLRDQGLTVTWDGDAETRMVVDILWRRRRPDPAPPPFWKRDYDR